MIEYRDWLENLHETAKLQYRGYVRTRDNGALPLARREAARGFAAESLAQAETLEVCLTELDKRIKALEERGK